MDENENRMRIGIEGPVTFSCLNGEVPVSLVAFEVATNNEKRARVASPSTVRESALEALQKLARGKTFFQFNRLLEEGGAVILPGDPVYFLLKDSVKFKT